MDTRRILDAGTWLALGLAVTLTPAAQAWAAQGAPAEEIGRAHV